ncbi:MAG: hypothetical protein Q9165_003549 [Trypethelium subeluteriae]
MTSHYADGHTEGLIREAQSSEQRISSKFENSGDLTSIKLCNTSVDGKDVYVQLHQHVWQTSLLRGPWKAEFQSIWDKYIAVISSHAVPIEELQRLPSWKEGVTNFLDDLSNFASNEAAQRRLLGTNSAFSLGEPYFDAETVAKILRLPSPEGTLEKQLQNLAQKKMDRDRTTEWCSSHELFPLYERAFEFNYRGWKSGIDYKKWKKNRESKAKKEERGK